MDSLRDQAIEPLERSYPPPPNSVSTGSSSDIADAMAAVLFSQNLKPIKASEREDLFVANDRAVLRGRVRRHLGMVKKLGVDEEGANYLLGRVGSGMGSKVQVVIVENFVGEPYYKFLYDGEDLFGGCV